MSPQIRRSPALGHLLPRQSTVVHRRGARQGTSATATSAMASSGRSTGRWQRRHLCGDPWGRGAKLPPSVSVPSPPRLRVATALLTRTASIAAAACGLAGLMQDAPWCRLTTSPMRLSRGAVGGVGLDLVWPLICLPWPVPRAPLVATFRACAMSSLVLAMLIQRCRHTAFAMRLLPAAVTKTGTDRA